MDYDDYDEDEGEWQGDGILVSLSQLIDHPRPKKEKAFEVFVIDRKIPAVALRILEQSCNVHSLPNNGLLPRQAELRLSQMMQGIYTDGSVKMDSQFFQRTAPFLKVICVVGHDVSFIDITEAKRRKILIGTSGCASAECGAEVAIALAIVLGRHLRDSHILAPMANWGETPGQSLNESVVGIVGLGRLGMAIARKVFAFRPLCIAYYSRRAKKYAKVVCAERVLFNDLIEQCDFIFICCHCNNKYQNMFRDSVFVKMKPTAVLINMSNGGLFNLDDLFCALKKKKLAAAGMDAGVPNPPPFDHPIYRLPNFLVSGRVGERSVRARLAMSVLSAKDLVAGLQGRKMEAPYDFDPPIVETEEEKCIRKQEKALALCRAEVTRLLEEKKRLKEERRKQKGATKSDQSQEEILSDNEEDQLEIGEEIEESVDE